MIISGFTTMAQTCALSLCALPPSPHGLPWDSEDTPCLVSSGADGGVLSHSDISSIIIVLLLMYVFRRCGHSDYYYVLYNPRATLLANIRILPATATLPPAVCTRSLLREDWLRGGEFRCGCRRVALTSWAPPLLARLCRLQHASRGGMAPMSQSTAYEL